MPPFEESHYPIDPDYRQPDGDGADEQPSVPNVRYYPYPERRPHSVYGIISLAMAIFFAVAIFILFCICGYIGTAFPEVFEQDPPPMGIALVSLGLIAGYFAELAALTIGIIGICEPRTRKVLSLCGIVFSAMTLFFTVGFLVLAIAFG